jgi:hypothetical protein
VTLGLLFLAPALLLAALLLLRRYPGERLLLARIPRRRRPARRAQPVLAWPAAILGRPGRLVAGRDEIRGPPHGVVLPAVS